MTLEYTVGGGRLIGLLLTTRPRRIGYVTSLRGYLSRTITANANNVNSSIYSLERDHTGVSRPGWVLACYAAQIPDVAVLRVHDADW